MSVMYRLSQNTNSKVGKQGKWYAKAVALGTTHTKELAAIMQRNCTVKQSDIEAVLTELVETMRDQLQQGRRVSLDGFGNFKLCLRSEGADTAKKFKVREHIKGVFVRFTPEATRDQNGVRTKTFLEGVTVEELPENKTDKTEGEGQVTNP